MKFRLKIGDKEFEVEILETEGGTKIKIDSKEFLFKEARKPQRILTQEEKILAPISGQITEIFVEEGKAVKEGDKLLCILAMKMENEILSPCSAFVKKVFVKRNQLVKKGDLLIILSP